MALTYDDFERAITALDQHWQGLEQATEWRVVKLLRQHGTAFLRIEREVREAGGAKGCGQGPDEVEQVEEEEEEEDSETVAGAAGAAQGGVVAVVVTYDIVHSISYAVPVLYATVRSEASARRLGVQETHDMLVPAAWRRQIKSVGVVGALSMTDHPLTSMPVHFVHPCQTQDAMRAVLNGKDACPTRYLLLWLGLVGGSVGLNVPVELVQSMQL